MTIDGNVFVTRVGPLLGQEDLRQLRCVTKDWHHLVDQILPLKNNWSKFLSVFHHFHYFLSIPDFPASQYLEKKTLEDISFMIETEQGPYTLLSSSISSMNSIQLIMSRFFDFWQWSLTPRKYNELKSDFTQFLNTKTNYPSSCAISEYPSIDITPFWCNTYPKETKAISSQQDQFIVHPWTVCHLLSPEVLGAFKPLNPTAPQEERDLFTTIMLEHLNSKNDFVRTTPRNTVLNQAFNILQCHSRVQISDSGSLVFDRKVLSALLEINDKGHLNPKKTELFSDIYSEVQTNPEHYQLSSEELNIAYFLICLTKSSIDSLLKSLLKDDTHLPITFGVFIKKFIAHLVIDLSQYSPKTHLPNSASDNLKARIDKTLWYFERFDHMLKVNDKSTTPLVPDTQQPLNLELPQLDVQSILDKKIFQALKNIRDNALPRIEGFAYPFDRHLDSMSGRYEKLIQRVINDREKIPPIINTFIFNSYWMYVLWNIAERLRPFSYFKATNISKITELETELKACHEKKPILFYETIVAILNTLKFEIDPKWNEE